MVNLPDLNVSLLVRTYFGSDDLWGAVRDEIEQGTDEGFHAIVEFIDDRQYEGLTAQQLESTDRQRASQNDLVYLADERAQKEPSHPLLVVRVGGGPDLPFRCRADVLYEVDANLSLGNLDWDDFRDQVDHSSVYGGVTVAEPDPNPPVHPAVAAYKRGSKASVTISLPAGTWFLVYGDLWEAHSQIGEAGYKQYAAIAARIVERDHGGKQQMDDADDITLPANEWAFIHARLLQTQYEPAPGHDDGLPHGDVSRDIAHLISRHLPIDEARG